MTLPTSFFLVPRPTMRSFPFLVARAQELAKKKREKKSSELFSFLSFVFYLLPIALPQVETSLGKDHQSDQRRQSGSQRCSRKRKHERRSVGRLKRRRHRCRQRWATAAAATAAVGTACVSRCGLGSIRRAIVLLRGRGTNDTHRVARRSAAPFGGEGAGREEASNAIL